MRSAISSGEQLRAGYDAPSDAVHPGGCALEREQRRALELLLGAVELLVETSSSCPAELLGDDAHGLLHVAVVEPT